MLLTMGVNISFLAGDLFNLYVGFEVFLVASYVLLTLGASAGRVRAGVGYVMVSMASSMIFLLALGFVYSSVGTMNMAQIGQRMQDIPEGTIAPRHLEFDHVLAGTRRCHAECQVERPRRGADDLTRVGAMPRVRACAPACRRRHAGQDSRRHEHGAGQSRLAKDGSTKAFRSVCSLPQRRDKAPLVQSRKTEHAGHDQDLRRQGQAVSRGHQRAPAADQTPRHNQPGAHQ